MSTKDDSEIAFKLFLRNDENGIKIEAEHPDLSTAEWVKVAKTGQVVDVNGELCVITAEALKSSVGTWKGKDIFSDHIKIPGESKIYGDKFEDPFLLLYVDKQVLTALDANAGGSIDAIATDVQKQKILNLTGVGYSVLSEGKMPACPKEAGCGIAGEGAPETKGKDVNIEGVKMGDNSNIVSGDKKVKPENQDTDKEEKDKEMTDKDEKSEVSFSKEQVAEIQAAAVLEKSEQLTALHQVALSEIETAHAAELKTLGETHTTALETQREEVQKQVEMIESLSTKFALSPEAKKTLIDAKSVEDVYTLLATLKVEKAEPVVEAEGKAKGHGITLENKVEAQAPKTRKVEEVGSYDPHTGKYIPTYREEIE